MQRLFSMFPTGRPGVALLLLRTALGAMLLEVLPGSLASPASSWILLAPWLVAIALCVGFLTPIAAVLCVAFQVAAWVLGGGSFEALHGCAVLVAVALALLGPGAYSLDAKFFGRRQVIFPPE